MDKFLNIVGLFLGRFLAGMIFAFSDYPFLLFFSGPGLEEYRMVLKPGRFLAGAIPAVGGLAWGLGRFPPTSISIPLPRLNRPNISWKRAVLVRPPSAV